jgi:zona occludens toxin
MNKISDAYLVDARQCSSPNCDVCTLYTEEDKQNMHPADMWHEWAPDGAVMFYDEVQNVYRPRTSGSKPPPSIQAFEVHRHRGLDFYLITQSPKLFDSNIRELISRHIHLRQSWTGRYQYEWPECKTNTQSTSDAVKSGYTLNAKTFSLYKSASLHTKQKRKIPFAVFLLIGVLAVLIFLGFRFYDRFVDRPFNVEAGDSQESTATQLKSLSSSKNSSEKPSYSGIPSQYDFKPVIRGKLETAPAYSHLVQVKDFPRNIGCVSTKDSCTCYTQQLTVYPVSLGQCLAQIDSKPESFDPYYEVEKEVQYKLLKPIDIDT